jgi:hypothetical protein
MDLGSDWLDATLAVQVWIYTWCSKIKCPPEHLPYVCMYSYEDQSAAAGYNKEDARLPD